jgi:type II secretory ATPase GspE/PulE/Tfp pilus assembly ATPase PilB-like protein
VRDVKAPASVAPEAGGPSDLSVRLTFFKSLQAVTTKIHATDNVDEIILDLSEEISAVFGADRLTIYCVDERDKSIVSKVKTGLDSFREIRLPISERSVAGFAALHRTPLNIRDVYDEAELRAYSPNLRFLKEVDRRSGYRTRQMLVGPITEPASGELLGVVQLINNRAGVAFSGFLEEGLLGLAQTLAIAFAQRRKAQQPIRTKYGSLVEDAVLSATDFELATRSARRKGVDLEEVLIDELQVKPATIGRALSRYFDVPYAPYSADRIKPLDLLRNLKREYIEQNRWLPIEENDEGIVVLTVDPEQVRHSGIVSNVFPKAKLIYHVTTALEFNQTLDQFFGLLADAATVGDLLSILGEEDEFEISPADVTAAAENELVRLVNRIIIDACQQGASDIHIEPRPGKEKTLVRLRKDGSLVPYIEVPASYRNAMVTRIKIMCDLDISERRKPQDGKIKFRKFGPLDVELRVATLPTAGGMEDVVMRILSSGEPLPLEKLGVLPHNLERLKRIITKPHGLFFVCGPTGSGKTTTLHSILSHINTPETKIWTAEDPVEITQKGLRQVQVNRKAGLDFATAMRAFLRADPDVIMVGEMRDRETAAIGIEASLTGHLVFATLHTNSAPESVTRLLDMGMDSLNFADALLGILAQRLAKRLCGACKKAYTPAAAEMEQLLAEYCEELANTEAFHADDEASRNRILHDWKRLYADEEGRFTLYRAGGCTECNNTGYKGRVGLHELMVGSDNIKRLIQEKARVATLLAAALEDGMRTLKMDGLEKVLMGLTDVKQVRMVCIK